MLTKHAALVQRFIEEVWNHGRDERCDELLAPDHGYHDPAAPRAAQGPGGYRALIQQCRHAFPDVRVSIEDQLVVGDRVVTRWSLRATHSGTLGALLPTGRAVGITGVTIDRVTGGRIRETWNHWDSAGLLRQIDAPVRGVPRPTAAAREAGSGA